MTEIPSSTVTAASRPLRGRAAVRHALRLRQCLSCEYDLRGLPERGRCPECGTTFDDDMVIPVVTRGGGLIAIVAALVFAPFFLIGSGMSLINGDTLPALTWGVFGGVMGIVAVRTIRDTSRAAPELVQAIVITNSGIMRRLPGVSPRIFPWKSFQIVTLVSRGQNCWRLTVSDEFVTFRLSEGTNLSTLIRLDRRQAAHIRGVIRRHIRRARVAAAGG